MGGQLVRLELWEKAWLAATFGFVDDDGIRQYNLSVLIIGKKNGKSLLASAIGLYMLIGDGEPGPEVYAVATKRDQAKIIWQEAKRMVRKSETLLKRIKPLLNELSSEDYNCGVFKPLASDSDTLDGLNVHCCLMDELHQWKNGRQLYDIMADGTIGRDQPLILVTTTAGKIREDIYDEIYDDAVRTTNGLFDDVGYKDEHSLYIIYELDKREEWEKPDCWEKANPGLGTIKNRNALASKVKKAQANPSLVRNLVCKEFNIAETSTESWLNFEELNNETKFDVKELCPTYGIGGADLSSTTDLTAAKMLFRVPDNENIYVMSMYWIPADLVEKKVAEDKIPYDKWIEQGFMRTCPGNKIDASVVTAWYQELQDECDIYLWKEGYDAWSAQMWVNQMIDAFGPTVMEAVHQGKKTLSAPMKALKADLVKKRIIYNNNPIDKWCLANTAIDEDRNGNIQPIKTSKSTRRIDGTAALLDAYTIYFEYEDEYLSIV
ncbi:terminase large subunit [Ruminococcus bromii]|nr:terminase large subunit [Ruminococcus bromii]RGI80508.1 terminase large subunit [Ruminococcus bromii]